MPTREASIKVTLDSGPFRSDTRRMEGFMESAGRKMGAAIKGPLKAGFESAKTAAGDLMSSMKQTLELAGTLGGAVSVGALVQGAVKSEQAYIQLADQLTTTTGQVVDQAEAQALVEEAATNAKVGIEDMQASLNQLAGVGDLDTIGDAMERSAMQAKRMGIETSIVARSTSRLLAKGLAGSAEEAELLLDRMSEYGRTVLGIDPDEAIDPTDVAEFAAFVKSTNSSTNEMITLLSKTGDTAKDLGGALEIIEELGLVLNTRKGLTELGKANRTAKNATDLSAGSVENLLSILETGSPKAIKALEDALGTDRAKAALGAILGEQLTLDIATGKASKEQIRAVGERLRDELENSADDQARLNRIAETNAKLAKTSGAKFQDALLKIEKAFQKPEMISAIDRITDRLPQLAEKLVEFLDWVTANPGKAAAGVVAAKVGLAFGGAFVQKAAADAITGMFGKIAAQQAATKALSIAAGSRGAQLGVGGAIGAAGSAGGVGAAVGAAATTAAAVVGAGAAGAAVGYGIYKYGGVEEGMNEEFASRQAAGRLVTDTSRLDEKTATQDELAAALREIAKAQADTRESESITNTLAGAAAFAASGGDQALNPFTQRQKVQEDLAAEQKRLAVALETLRKASEHAGRSLKATGDNARRAGNATRGVDEPPAAVPGAAATAPRM